ncbi:SDR family oxidoreductase [Desertibaculum subflavum]|uniref:SDR family oxidoreductase n=1 Tax=Desertibaculum subflavum TaxID=2268458 RepID=UPI000E66841D
MSRVLLITGGASGIGAEVARLAAAQGYAVAVNYRSKRDKAEALVAGLGGKAIAVPGDVADPSEVEAMFAATEKALGPLTHLVNSAGLYVTQARVEDFDAGDLARLFQVNVIGTMLCCREAVRRMSTARGGKGGAIVNVSSMAATTGGRAGSSAYAATKGAIDVFTQGLAREVAAEGIRANVVRPGFTLTDMTAATAADPRRVAAIAATIPIGRIGTALESAWPIMWLLSDEQASFVSGTAINASGGGFVIGAPAGR